MSADTDKPVYGYTDDELLELPTVYRDGLFEGKVALVSGAGTGLGKATAPRVGLILSQGGEFAFVAFRMARSLGILTEDMTKLMLTCVSLTMAITPFLESVGSKMEKKVLEEERAKLMPNGRKIMKRA